MEKDPILKETLSAIDAILGRELDSLAVERAIVGLFFTGVKLEEGSAGSCATPREGTPEAECCPASVAAMPFAGRLRGMPARELAEEALSPHGIRRALGIAAMNALAETCWRRRPHPDTELCIGLDAFDASRIRPGEKVVLVGAFVPFLRELKRRGQPYLVLERDARRLKPDELPYFRPAEEAGAVVPQAEVLLVTGSTLLNDALEALLRLAKPDCRVAVVGPTVGLLPDAFYARGADILGSVLIRRPDEFLDVLAEGGGAHHFLGRSAEKVALVRRPTAQAAAD